MNLPIPGVGTEDGPAYATDINSCLTIIDQHSHLNGSGVPITPAAININTALDFQSNFATSLAGLTLAAQNSTPANNTIYESGVDLYYVDGLGNNIQITANGGIAGSPGSISNLTSPASASYVAGSTTFVWQSDVNTSAKMDCGSILIRNATASSQALTLSPPAAMGSSYTVTLPSLPAAQKFMTLDNAGTMSAPWAVDGSTIVVSSNTVKVPTGGITGTQITSNVNLPGTAAQENGKNLVVSNTNATVSLSIIRGSVNGSAAIIAGEGFTAGFAGTTYTITFTTAFADTPVVILGAAWGPASPVIGKLLTTSTTTFTFNLLNTAGTSAAFGGCSFLVIGQRA